MSKLKGLLYSLIILAFVSCGTVNSGTDLNVPTTFISFTSFVNAVENAHYPENISPNSGISVQSQQAFNDMRSYILDTYANLKAVSSYVLDSQYFDCIPMDSQPAVRHLHIKQIATPPPMTDDAAVSGKENTPGAVSISPLTLGQKDEFGNTIGCQNGNIPMQRLTLERMIMFPTLQAFLAKVPGGQKAALGLIQPGGPHRYAHAYQRVTNYGGNSWLNLWNPSGEFSLSQQWYAGGSDSNLQTVEGGWVHYPGKFGNQSVLFIYYTPDGYSHGCYNLECSAFVQTNKNWALGGKWTNYSTLGGTQYGFTMQWKYYHGNWWLFIQGAGSIQAVGYYPGSIYNHGQLASNAQMVDYGGETDTGSQDWPQMGSGKFASAGWQQAAYQRTIFYLPKDESGGTGVWTSLSTNQTNPTCYTIKLTPYTNGGSWGTYFYFGGPGGKC